MKIKFFFIIILVYLCGCSKVALEPNITVDTSNKQGLQQRCLNIFPKQSWQFSHTIHFSATNGYQGNLIGITVLKHTNKGLYDFDLALMTMEGLVLFQANQSQGKLNVIRALPPFDKPAFGGRLIEDIKTIFIPPPGEIKTALCNNKTPCCQIKNQGVTIIITPNEGGYSFDKYDPQKTLILTGEYSDKVKAGDKFIPPRKILLSHKKKPVYTIELRLIEAVRIAANKMAP